MKVVVLLVLVWLLELLSNYLINHNNLLKDRLMRSFLLRAILGKRMTFRLNEIINCIKKNQYKNTGMMINIDDKYLYN